MEVAKALVKAYDSNVKYAVSGNFRLGDIRDNFADLNKIQRDLGFRPKISFEEGIERFCNWVSSQEIQEDDYNKSISEMKDKGLLK
jgi:dTDP-L-rhamnose 4-epimerase